MARADFIGVHSKKEAMKNSFSSRSKAAKSLFFVWKTTDKRIFIQAINAAYDVIEESPRQITKVEFQNNYRLEPRILAAPILPFAPSDSEEELASIIENIELEPKKIVPPRQLTQEELEKEAKQAAIRLEKNIRKEFALHLARIRTGNTKDAVKKIASILEIRQGIIPAHKHMFTDFGIDLRKVTQYKLALKAYERALELGINDANIYFNLARLHLDMKDYSLSWKAISHSLHIDPEHYYSLKLRTYLTKVDQLVFKI